MEEVREEVESDDREGQVREKTWKWGWE
jgi:hypothetical protein